MDLSGYRESDTEKQRTRDLMAHIQAHADGGRTALDIGARDGHFSRLLAEHFASVVALDLERPVFQHANVSCVQGDVTALDFPDDTFDFVFCAEVLEHIPAHLLERACAELSRVSRKFLLIGVPYRQDIRVGRTTCYSCGEKNPPWGHVNRFDRERLRALFPCFKVHGKSFVGSTHHHANSLSTLLMDLAGNPYGTYTQEEPCVHCGEKLKPPPGRSLAQKILTRAAFYTLAMQRPFVRAHPSWIHVLFEKQRA